MYNLLGWQTNQAQCKQNELKANSCFKHHNNFIGEQCQIGDLPVAISAPSAVIFDDVPLFCGGHKTGDPTTNCYKLRDDLTWDQVNWLS